MNFSTDISAAMELCLQSNSNYLQFFLACRLIPINCNYFFPTSEYEKMACRLIGNYHGRESHHSWTPAFKSLTLTFVLWECPPLRMIWNNDNFLFCKENIPRCMFWKVWWHWRAVSNNLQLRLINFSLEQFEPDLLSAPIHKSIICQT